MGIFEGAKLWRRMGALANTRAGSGLLDGVGGLVGKAATLVGVPRLDEEPPWAPWTASLPEARLAIVTTAGLHHRDDEPFDVDVAEGDPSFRSFSSGVAADELKLSHTHFSHRRYDEDPEVILPLSALREIVAAGVVGSLAPRFYSFGFGGYLTEPYVAEPDGSARVVARKLLEDQVDFALLVPA